jgi:hypothetical protein
MKGGERSSDFSVAVGSTVHLKTHPPIPPSTPLTSSFVPLAPSPKKIKLRWLSTCPARITNCSSPASSAPCGSWLVSLVVWVEIGLGDFVC